MFPTVALRRKLEMSNEIPEVFGDEKFAGCKVVSSSATLGGRTHNPRCARYNPTTGAGNSPVDKNQDPQVSVSDRSDDDGKENRPQ